MARIIIPKGPDRPYATSRDRYLVRLMENLGYMDRLGRGLPMVCQEAQKLNKSVTFEEAGEMFRVVLQL
ncbi:ATP-binding protein [Desulfonatronum thioautotrophicum]|uniref:ATP-binding protein n=1 Tax=Desulfonatronum thioautotrophicum TaxID=617001 RepID=UPI0005EB5106|nr:ATP-binding protein [Desulfonatronum thioautotrophicum]